MRIGRLWITAVMLGLAATGTAAAQTVRTVAAGGSLQAALDAAQPGDTILLEAGATFVGNFVLPNKGGSAYITIRSSAADTSLPPAGQRITPGYAAQLPKIRSGNSMSALATAPGAHHWRLLFLEFQANDAGHGDIIRLGTTTTTNLADQPTEIIIDRCYIHGDPWAGQKNGISLQSRTTEIRNSYISDIKGLGQETHAITGTNGPGPYVITNNYIEASGINFMLGGVDPKIVNNVPGMALGPNGYGVTVTGNHIRKNPDWMQPFVPTPAGVLAAAATGGSLAAGTYGYRIVARMPSYQGTLARSSASAEVTTTVGSSGAVTVTWAPVAGATTYRVHGRTPGAQSIYFDVSSGTACTPVACSFTDSGAAGTSGGVAAGSRWLVKNLFELKIGENVLVEGNLLEYNWYGAGDQPGYGMLFRSNPATDTGAPWTVVQNVTIRNNILRHSPGGINIVGIDGGSGSRQAVRANTFRIRNNLLEDIAPANWGGGNARVFSMSGTIDVTIDHNTIVNDGPGLIMASSNGSVVTNEGFVYTNNLSKRGKYGVKGDSEPEGNGTLSIYFPGAVFRRNAIFGAPSSSYPPDNFYPSLSTWDEQFASVAVHDYRLASTSPYNDAGTDGKDVGADIDAILAAGAGGAGAVLTPEAPALAITTTSLPDGLAGAAYSAMLQAQGGSGGYIWQVSSGALPSGLALATDGLLSGTPSAAGSFSFTVTVQDTAGASASAPFAIAIAAPARVRTTIVLDAPDTHVVDVSIQNGSSSDTVFDGATFGTRAGTPKANTRRALVKFDTQNTILAGSSIHSAVLYLTVSGGDARNRTLGAYRVKYSFEEPETTWLQRKIGNPWETPGGDLGSLYASVPVSASAGQVIAFDVTQLVQETCADAFGSGAYTRIAILDLGGGGAKTSVEFHSSESANTGARPRLVVDYTTP